MGRTFHDRWFTWPWRPWVKTRMYQPRLPDPYIYRFEDDRDGQYIAAHPETLRRLLEARNDG